MDDLMGQIMVPGLSEAESQELESLFTQDRPGEKPASISKKIGNALVAKGYAEPTHFVVGRGPLSVKVKTFHITIAGHMAYCAACPDFEETEMNGPR